MSRMPGIILSLLLLLPVACSAAQDEAWILEHQDCLQQLLQGSVPGHCPDSGAMIALKGILEAESKGGKSMLCDWYVDHDLTPSDIWRLPQIVYRFDAFTGLWTDRFQRDPALLFMDAAVLDTNNKKCISVYVDLYQDSDGYFAEEMKELAGTFFMDPNSIQQNYDRVKPILPMALDGVAWSSKYNDLDALKNIYSELPHSDFRSVMLSFLRKAMRKRVSAYGYSPFVSICR